MTARVPMPALKARGWSHDRIARHFMALGQRISGTSVWYALSKAGQAKQRERNRLKARVHPADLPMPEPERLPPLPRDTRDLTGRICGDPLPGRSALDQHHQQEEASQCAH